MLDFIFRSSGHRSLGIEYGIAIVIQNRSFGASDIILQGKARSTVFKDGLHKFWILLVGKTGADWDSAPEQTGTLLMLQS